MKIGIFLLNASPYYRGGTNSFIHGFLSSLKKVDRTNQYILFVYKHHRECFERYAQDNIHLHYLKNDKFRYFAIKQAIKLMFVLPGLRIFYLFIENLMHWKLIRAINVLGIDLFYSPIVPIFPFGIEGKVIVSPHDIQQTHYPENFSLFVRWYRYTIFNLSVKRAVMVQASSRFMKNDFKNYFMLPEGRLRVIPEGIMEEFFNFQPDDTQGVDFLKKYGLRPGYIFYPSQHWPHKNHKTLIRAIDYVRRKYDIDFELVCTGEIRGFLHHQSSVFAKNSWFDKFTLFIFSGQRHDSFQDLYDFVIDNGFDKFVKFIGNVKFSELFYAYHYAEMVVLPVIYESSSLPLREAMALGKPVIASRNGVNEEMNIDENIILFDTFDYKDLGEKIYALHGNESLKKKLIEKSKILSWEFGWDKIAKMYVDLFNKINEA